MGGCKYSTTFHAETDYSTLHPNSGKRNALMISDMSVMRAPSFHAWNITCLYLHFKGIEEKDESLEKILINTFKEDII